MRKRADSAGRQPHVFRWRRALIERGPEHWGSPTRAILLVLSDFMDNDTGEGWPSQSTIAKGAGVRRETVSRKLRQVLAEEDPWLRRVRVRPQSWRRDRWVYKAVIPRAVLVGRECDPESQVRTSLGPNCDEIGGKCDLEANRSVSQSHTNSVNSMNSLNDPYKDQTTNSATGRSPPELLDLASKLGPGERVWVIELLGLTGFPPERVGAQLLASLKSDDLSTLRKMIDPLIDNQ